MAMQLLVSFTAPSAYRSLSQAVQVASDGSTIFVDPGHHHGPLIVRNKQLTVRATGAPASVTVESRSAEFGTVDCVDGALTVRGLSLVAWDSTLGGVVGVRRGQVTLQHCSVAGQAESGVLASDDAKVHLSNCRIHDLRRGATLLGAGGVIEHCAFEQIGEIGVLVKHGADPALSDCRFTGAKDGFQAFEGGRGSIDRCTFSSMRQSAIFLGQGSQTTVRGAVVTGGDGYAVYADNHARGTITDCRFDSTGGSAVALRSGAEVSVERCKINNAGGNGILVDDARGVLDACECNDTALPGIAVTNGANPDIRGCVVRRTPALGLMVENARGSITDLRVESAGDTGILVKGGTPRIVRAYIRDTPVGVFVDKKDTRVRLEGVRVVDATMAGVMVRDGNATLADCLITNVKDGNGIFAHGSATLQVTDSKVWSAARDGLFAAEDSTVEVIGGELRNCGGSGARIHNDASASFTDCLVSGNGGHGVHSDTSGTVVMASCTLTDNTDGDAQGAVTETASAATADVTGPETTRPADSTAPGTVTNIDQLVGLDEVKQEIRRTVNLIRMSEQRKAAGLPAVSVGRHMVFSGPPGTGKTTVARLYAQTLHQLKLLERPKVVEVSRPELVGEYLGHTAARTKAAFERARGGVLFIDEAHSLSHQIGITKDFGIEAIDTLVKLMEDHRDEVVVIVAGYGPQMRQFLKSNPGLASRFSRTVEFRNYTPNELGMIVEDMAQAHGYVFADDARNAITTYLQRSARTDQFGNGRGARRLFEQMVQIQADRLATLDAPTVEQMRTLTVEDLPAEAHGRAIQRGWSGPDPDEVTAVRERLAAFVGQDQVKREITDLLQLSEAALLRSQAGLAPLAVGLNALFVGPPGTGKTSVARLYGELLAALNMLPSGHLVEVSRADLVGEWQGQTAARTQEAFERARGGILFIDEAYALASPERDEFGREAVATLVKLMEDMRGEVVVVAAGYEPEMDGFLRSNSGLASRFSRRLRFTAFTPEQLAEIFRSIAVERGFRCEPEVESAVTAYFASAAGGDGFGNGRAARDLVDASLRAHARRVTGMSSVSPEELSTLRVVDIQESTS